MIHFRAQHLFVIASLLLGSAPTIASAQFDVNFSRVTVPTVVPLTVNGVVNANAAPLTPGGQSATDNDFFFGTSANGLDWAIAAHVNVGPAEAISQVIGTGKISISEEALGYVADHDLATGHLGMSRVDAFPWVANSNAFSEGRIRASYKPSTPYLRRKSDRTFTSQHDLFFLAVGPTHNLADTDVVNESGFFQRVQIMGSSIEAIHLGDGLFLLSGALQKSTEMAPSAAPEVVLEVAAGGLNHRYFASEVSTFGSTVNVEIFQHSNTASSRWSDVIIADPNAPSGFGTESYIYSFSNSASLYGKNLNAGR